MGVVCGNKTSGRLSRFSNNKKKDLKEIRKGFASEHKKHRPKS